MNDNDSRIEKRLIEATSGHKIGMPLSERPPMKNKDFAAEVSQRFRAAFRSCGQSVYSVSFASGLVMRTLNNTVSGSVKAVPLYLAGAVAFALKWSPETLYWIATGEGEAPPGVDDILAEIEAEEAGESDGEE